MASLSLQFHPFLSFPTKRPHPQHKCFVPLRAEAGKVKTKHTALESPALLRRPIVGPPSLEESDMEEVVKIEDEEVRKAEVTGRDERPQDWVWEDTILEDTVPLVGFVRMILHSGKYECGDRLTPEHESAILDKLLPYHPEYEMKVGCGVDYIKVGFHHEFNHSRCLFIVRKDGEEEDFSFWKCIKGLIRKKYPLYAEQFISKHFHKRRRD